MAVYMKAMKKLKSDSGKENNPPFMITSVLSSYRPILVNWPVLVVKRKLNLRNDFSFRMTTAVYRELHI